MNLSKFKWVAMALVMLCSCGGNDDNKIDNPDGPQGSGSMEEMTPEQSKEFLQTTATDFLNLFNPQDQKQVIELAAYFSSEFENYEVPEEFEIEPDGQKRTPAPYMKAVAQAAKGDLDALTRAATTYSYTIKFEKFAGIYEPDSKEERWVKTGNSSDLIFKFTNKSGQPVEMKVTQSGGTSDLDFSVSDWDYDYINGNYQEFEYQYNYFLFIPKNVTATLVENGQELVKTTVVSSIDVKGHKISADVNATLMNIQAIGKTEGTDSKVEATAEFYVSGEKVATSYATINGNNLCNQDKFEAMEDMDDEEVAEELAKMFKNGSCGANVLDKVQVYGQIQYYKDLYFDLDGYWSSWDYDNKATAEAECKKVCDRLNNNIKTQLRYNNTATDQATIQFVPFLDEWGSSSWEYWVSANLLFPDKTTYNIDSYFDRFTNVSNKWNSLISSYEKLWETAGGVK